MLMEKFVGKMDVRICGCADGEDGRENGCANLPICRRPQGVRMYVPMMCRCRSFPRTTCCFVRRIDILNVNAVCVFCEMFNKDVVRAPCSVRTPSGRMGAILVAVGASPRIDSSMIF